MEGRTEVHDRGWETHVSGSEHVGAFLGWKRHMAASIDEIDKIVKGKKASGRETAETPGF